MNDVDDWMGDVENAIAMALKKDGIEPKIPKLGMKSSTKEQTKIEAASGSGKTSKRRKHKNTDKSPRKKQRKQDDDNDRLPASNDSEDFDDYEMMNVRGGSPPSHGGQSGSGHSHKQSMLYYDSDGSYTSYDSYDSGEHRMRRQRGGKRKNHERNTRGGNNRNKRCKWHCHSTGTKIFYSAKC